MKYIVIFSIFLSMNLFSTKVLFNADTTLEVFSRTRRNGPFDINDNLDGVGKTKQIVLNFATPATRTIEISLKKIERDFECNILCLSKNINCKDSSNKIFETTAKNEFNFFLIFLKDQVKTIKQAKIKQKNLDNSIELEIRIRKHFLEGGAAIENVQRYVLSPKLSHKYESNKNNKNAVNGFFNPAFLTAKNNVIINQNSTPLFAAEELVKAWGGVPEILQETGTHTSNWKGEELIADTLLENSSTEEDDFYIWYLNCEILQDITQSSSRDSDQIELDTMSEED